MTWLKTPDELVTIPGTCHPSPPGELCCQRAQSADIIIINGGNHFVLGVTAEGARLLRASPLWDGIPAPPGKQLLYLLHRKTLAQYSSSFVAHFNF